MPPTVILLGASGLLGRAVHKALLLQDTDADTPPITLIPTAHSRATDSLLALDVTDEEALRAFLSKHAAATTATPTVVINCVAERRPDAVEADPDKAHKLNVRLVEILAEESAKLGYYLVHISTDYVFDGTQPPYKPEDPTHPLQKYGEDKLAAEEVLKASAGTTNWVILRVPVLYGESTDLAESSITVLAKDVLAKEKPKKVDDWSSRFATHTEDVAKVLRAMVLKAVVGEGAAPLKGTYHFSSLERDPATGKPYTKYTLSLLLGEIMKASTSHLTPDSAPPSGAPRPQNCELDISSLREALRPEVTAAQGTKEGLTKAIHSIYGGER